MLNPFPQERLGIIVFSYFSVHMHLDERSLKCNLSEGLIFSSAPPCS